MTAEVFPQPTSPDIPTRFRIPGYREMRESLKQTKSLRSLVHTAEEIALHGFPSIAKDTLPEIDPTSERVMNVLKNGDYEGAEMTLEDYGQLHRAKSLYHKTIRDVVGDILEDSESALQISPEQRIALRYGLKMQNESDDIDVLWHDELVLGPNAAEIKEKMADKAFADTTIGPHGEFIYGIIRKNDGTGQYEYLTHAQAYPKQIQRIAGHIDAMIAELTPLAQEGSEEAQSLITTHTLFKEHITMTGKAEEGIAHEQEERAKAFHSSWVVQAPQHTMSIDYLPPMEAYSAGSFVEWQYDLLVKIPGFANMNENANDTKRHMIHLLKTDEDLRSLTTLQQSIAILEPTESTVYLRLPSGTSLRFRSAASNVPNQPEVRLAKRENSDLAVGSKINFDYETLEQRDEIGRPLREAVFGKERADEIFGDTKDLIPLLLSRFVAGHEDAHNILEREDTLNVMSVTLHMNLDEAKADLASLYTCFDSEFLSLGERQDLARALFAEELRGLSRWGERKVDRTHLNGNIMLIQLMMDTNILRNTNGEWTFDVSSPEKLTALSHKGKEKLLELAKVYEATNSTDAGQKGEDFIQKYFATESLSDDMLQLMYDAKIMHNEEYQTEMAKRSQATPLETLQG